MYDWNNNIIIVIINYSLRIGSHISVLQPSICINSLVTGPSHGFKAKTEVNDECFKLLHSSLAV